VESLNIPVLDPFLLAYIDIGIDIDINILNFSHQLDMGIGFS